VPIGSCLSGGLDSSSIVCVVNNLLKKEKILNIGEKQKTFSACFETKRFDERKYIRQIIKQTGAEKNYVFPQPTEFLQDLDKLLWHQEEPFAGTSVYAQWKVMEMASKKIKVLLDGQGGDELLCGYRKFYIFYLQKLLRNHRYLLFINECAKFFSSIDILKTLNIRRGLKYFRIGKGLLKLDTLFNSQFLNKFNEQNLAFGYQNNIGKRIKEDFIYWSLPVLLRYEDKNSMAFAIEARVPFLDYQLVEIMSALPLNQKMRNGWTRFVLRSAMKRILPEKIRLRKNKLGFDTPEDIWFKKIMYTEIDSVFRNASFISNYVDIKKLLDCFKKYRSGWSIYTSNLFFRFFILELWGRKFLMNE
jgi:asparagine synthase (glutamine-hydrolysing)